MRKGKRMVLLLLTGLAVLTTASCSSGNEAEKMDFHEQMEWKIPDPALGERPRILFVGNSHTFYNNFSGMFVNIVEAKGKKSSVFELSQGYYTLKKFCDLEDKGGALLDKTLTKQWDIVVLQENSQEALSETADEDMFPYARILDEKIRAMGGQTAFFMTWAPRDGLKDGMKKKSREELQNVTKADALKHPNWKMGAKITIDCATLMNKGLEFIEAMRLYRLPPEKIQIVIHRQSVVHSLVEFVDGAVMAQLGTPDMRLPIQLALTYPSRLESPVEALDLLGCGALTF